ncbi:hypothetical protein BGW80DRAFT_1490177 [Lactifluus volemus]|nr:hypothetical protein BGW80DRAFT_1490177 [Lactifluus volemus]
MSSSSRLPCLFSGCPLMFKSQHGRTYHVRTFHINSNVRSYPGQSQSIPESTQAPPPHGSQRIEHPHLKALPCDANGTFLPPGSQPTPRAHATPDDWTPFENKLQFLVADLLYRRVEMSATSIDLLMELWASSMDGFGTSSPFRSHQHMYATVDSSSLGGVTWRCLVAGFSESIPRSAPSWKRTDYEVWYRDPDEVVRTMLDNPDFDGQFDMRPYIELDKRGKRCWSNFMSANIAWNHCDDIALHHPDSSFGAMYCPLILGSDKTTVSVATGHVEYHPLYLSIGNPHNKVRCAHRNAVIPIAFLAIPKGDRRYDNDPEFRKFKRQLYHASISAILRTLQPGMTSPVIRRCPDGHYRRVIFDLVAFIADYPEQVMLTGIVQGWCPRCTASPSDSGRASGPRTRNLTDELIKLLDSRALWDKYGIDDDVVPFTADFPRADIHEMMSPDLLHQVIKGGFKDHLVTWVCDYLTQTYRGQANKVLDDIDLRIAAVPSFPGLRRFPHGRRFKQWTGDDSKALMKVYLPAIVGYVPDDMVTCISAFLDTCYIARRQVIDEDALKQFDTSFSKFLQLREIFRATGVRPSGFFLPRQHMLTHYHVLIQDFGAPSGLCSSITESRHITAVKKPWRRSSRFEALGQILSINQRLDKLTAMHSDFVSRGMLPAGHIPPSGVSFLPPRDDGPPTSGDDGEPADDNVLGHVVLAHSRMKNYPQTLQELAAKLDETDLPALTQRFLADQLGAGPGGALASFLRITTTVHVFHSATATFFAPSDPSGIRGMRRECIRATPSWRGKGPRHDTVFVVEDDKKPGMRGLNVARIRLFFSFTYNDVKFPCALVEWFTRVGVDHVTGMWVIRPDYIRNRRNRAVIHLDAILRAAHLIPIYGSHPLPLEINSSISLDTFRGYYVNKYIDHHAHEIVF